MVKNIWILFSIIAVGVAGYFMINKGSKTTEAKQITMHQKEADKEEDKQIKRPTVEVKNSDTVMEEKQEQSTVTSLKVDSDKPTANDDVPEALDQVSSQESGEETRQGKVILDPDSSEITYQEIQDDATLTKEEKEIKIMDKMYDEPQSDQSQGSLTAQEQDGLMQEDVENGLLINK